MLPGFAVHIVQRGNNRAECFRGDGDRLLYLTLLRARARELECALHAYCLMSNHVHLLLTPPSAAACAALMRRLGQQYVQYVNRTYERTGTLWEGRYRSCLVDSERYALACHRYIELNPVRAGMVSKPVDYPWSSHRANSGFLRDETLSAHAAYLALHEAPEARAEAYRTLFRDGLESSLVEEIRDATNGGRALGGSAFKAGLETQLGRKATRGRGGRPSKSGSEQHISHSGKYCSDPDPQKPSHTLS